jgi:segregation and condensation protein A
MSPDMASADLTANGASDWERAESPEPEDALRVDLAGFEGPLDLLLALARTHKLDLSAISVVQLVDQYLAYIARSDILRLEVAADYLVMAAWLTFLKSRLLLPKEKAVDGEPSGEELAGRLAFRLMRLDAMREAGSRLLTRRRLGRDIFPRGQPEESRVLRTTVHTATLYDLLKAYAEPRLRTSRPVHIVRARTVWSIKDARGRLEAMLNRASGEWVQLDLFIDQVLPSAEARRTVIASSFGASLELARDGKIELIQDRPFAPLFIRRRTAETAAPRSTATDSGGE